jgi:hypothetical protein
MNLKESYRYANYLDELLSTAYKYLSNSGFITTTTEEHLRSKANPDAKDETLEVQKSYDVAFTPDNVVDFVVKVIKEKEALAEAIADAKANAEIDIDNAIAMNKKKQYFASVLNNMANIKPSEMQTQGSDYRFNINNEQVKYYYPVMRKVSIDYKRDNVRNLAKKYLKETDEVSAKLDAITINTKVDFVCSFDITDKFEDVVLS